MKKVICFDLEGPLSPQDNAFEVAAKINDGKQLFEKISRYDDYLAEKDRIDHEPGDTLALIIPFFISHQLSNKEIKETSEEAKVVSGSKELINNLKNKGWNTYIISTSYEQHAYNVAQKLGVAKEKVYATNLDITKLKKSVDKDFIDYLSGVKEKILNTDFSNNLINYLNDFYFNKLPKTTWGNPLEKINVRGGQRKVKAMEEIAKKEKVELSNLVVVGDSITDYKMLKKIKEKEGKSIVFNGNKYAIPNASYGVGSIDIRILEPIIESNKPKEIVQEWEKNQKRINEDIKHIPSTYKEYGLDDIFLKKEKPPVINYLKNKSNEELKKVIKEHKYFRKNVRGEAAKLG